LILRNGSCREEGRGQGVLSSRNVFDLISAFNIAVEKCKRGGMEHRCIFYPAE